MNECVCIRKQVKGEGAEPDKIRTGGLRVLVHLVQVNSGHLVWFQVSESGPTSLSCSVIQVFQRSVSRIKNGDVVFITAMRRFSHRNNF